MKGWADSYDEVAWYTHPQDHTPDVAPHIEGQSLPSGGITHVAQGDWSVWFKTGVQHSHQHADLTQVSIQFQKQWVVVDPGTGTYNGPLEIRDAFRTSNAHNGFRVDNAHILTPHRAFRWLGDPKGASAPCLEIAGSKILFGAHDAFVSGYDTRVARAVVVSNAGVFCIDWLERPLPGTLTLALAPGTAVAGESLVLPDGSELCTLGLTDADVVTGSKSPFEGWHSETYGEWAPAPWLTARRAATAMSFWGVRIRGGDGIVTTGAQAHCGEVSLSAVFKASSVELSVIVEGDEHLLIARSPSA